jgi:hypothetical protein
MVGLLAYVNMYRYDVSHHSLHLLPVPDRGVQGQLIRSTLNSEAAD